ncbi:MAG: sulfotransferase [Pseudomonadales bacterium]|nr:sulfotransferase [Pseudomonadales bacterium]
MEMLGRARGCLARGDVARAEQFFRQVVAADSRNREALEQLVMISLRRGQADTAEGLLRQLATAYPGEPLYCDRLATLLAKRGRGAEAITWYRKLLAARPALNNSRYNLARLLKSEGLMQEALQEYRNCLTRKIDCPEEVLSNISIVHTNLHQHEEARQALEAALQHNPDYIPALYNLALLQEEEGDWPAARAAYERILGLEPMHPGALAHLANGEKIADPAHPVIGQLQAALGRDKLAPEAREDMLYALGKALDDCQQFDSGFDYYQQANEISRKRCGAYNRDEHERLVDKLISHCDQQWVESIEPVSDAPLVFISGMFRSGTTLLEQVLAAHPALGAGGEIDFFQRAVTPFPAGLVTANTAQLRSIGRDYVDYLTRHFPAQARVTNKRPDNLLCLGLFRALFPNARVINTVRDPLDNCISVFFQPLEAEQAYANDLLDTGHYYLQCQRLAAHWQSLLGDSMIELSYESLVEMPQSSIGRALEFLQLEWHEGCLTFHEATNRVRTASVHQVRRPLYSSSIGRWKNYANQLATLDTYLRT